MSRMRVLGAAAVALMVGVAGASAADIYSPAPVAEVIYNPAPAFSWTGGYAGGLIGYAFADLGGFEGAGMGAVTLLAALVGAGGVAVVAVLTLRALGEWRTIRERDDR